MEHTFNIIYINMPAYFMHLVMYEQLHSTLMVLDEEKFDLLRIKQSFQ